MLTLHGIANCDTVKRARAWLDTRALVHEFHDYRKAGVPAALTDWVAARGWEALLNRSGQTFRNLAEFDKADLDADRACALMRVHPAAIRRPVVTGGDVLIVGFKPDAWAAIFENPISARTKQ